jgi:uncharacterized protein (DUF2147 family)
MPPVVAAVKPIKAMKRMAHWLVVVIISSIGGARADRAAIDGVWLTDQGDGIVELKECGSAICGTVYAIIRLPNPSRPPLDARNENPELRERALCGVPIVGGMRALGADSWGEGWVYDPHTGKTYDAEITLENPNLLSIRGYLRVKLIGRTVSWTRAKGAPNRCVPPQR